MKHNSSHLSTDHTIVSNMSPRAHYNPYMLHTYSYTNSYNSSFNTSFTYSDDQYPDYSQNEGINRRIFEISYENIVKDGRTTVMIKNIPNKYTRNLLYEEINEEHENTYDFLYLPFDFNVNQSLFRITAMLATRSSTSSLQNTSRNFTRSITRNVGRNSEV